MKICFLGPSGYGKTTAVNILKANYPTVNIKIAEPLYELQQIFYDKIGVSLRGEQDGELLQFYGIKIRKENPYYLLNNFKYRLDSIDNDVNLITNDDCRPNDYEFLKALGFVFIKINGYKRDRCDHSQANPNLGIEWQCEIPYDYKLDNTGSIGEYNMNIINLMKEVKGEQKMLHRTNTKKM